MTVTSDYRDYLKGKLQDAAEHHSHYMKLCEDGTWGEINPCVLMRQYAKSMKEWQKYLDREMIDPRAFDEEAEIWRRRNLFPLH